jgi:DNA-binding transcriptional ArsR family regulator
MLERTLTAGERDHWRRRARVLKGMGHPTRLFILDELSHGERCVCELAEMVGADVSTVSRHLALLRSSGLVVDERRGAQAFHTLASPDVLDILRHVERILVRATVELEEAGERAEAREPVLAGR